LVWTQAGSGVVHHEVPADDRELHGLQLFVNLSAKNKLVEPRMLRLQGGDVPEWHGEDGDRVRIVVGAYDGRLSPLVPVEPFTFL
ncbi:pirin family protein, partial [Escherichia coli]|nr:pirin family protein [Escherichia coli]